jgi:hypothetical protein
VAKKKRRNRERTPLFLKFFSRSSKTSRGTANKVKKVTLGSSNWSWAWVKNRRGVRKNAKRIEMSVNFFKNFGFGNFVFLKILNF